MSGGPRERSLNVSDADARQVLGSAENTDGALPAQKPFFKPSCKVKRTSELVTQEKRVAMLHLRGRSSPSPGPCLRVPSLLKHEQLLRSNLSPNASCSSEASSDSVQSSSSSGKWVKSKAMAQKSKKLSVPKLDKNISDNASVSSQDSLESGKKRCAWVTTNTDSIFVAFHDEEWGVPVHDDKKLFELLVLSGALAELAWPNILSKRHVFREVFLDFDPVLISKMNEKKLVFPGSTATLLLSEPKLRAVIENARQILKIVKEYGSFDTYCWSFVNWKPIASRFRYPRQVPVKTPKAELISKDLVKRGFRSVGPTVIYSFMQAAGITNDHLTSCYRFEECTAALKGDKNEGIAEEKKTVSVKGGDHNLGLDFP